MEAPIESCAGDADLGTKPECAWLPFLQSSLQCCGYVQFNENGETSFLPDLLASQCSGNTVDEQNAAVEALTAPCNSAIVDAIENNLLLIFGALFGVIIFDIMVMASIIRFIRRIKREKLLMTH